MVVDSTYNSGQGASQKPLTEDPKRDIHRFTYRMIRSSVQPPALATQDPFFSTQPSQSRSQPSSSSSLAGQLSVGDPVVVSIEPSVLSLARGFVLETHAQHIILGLDHSLTALPGDLYDQDTFDATQLANIVYRIDKDELQAGMGRIRDNLAQLFYATGDEKRRRLIVDLERPVFDKDYKLSASEREKTNLNEDQLKAVNKVLTAQDYALILGMPGTGKTTTIGQVIKALTDRGKTVLLTSYTHSAVDNILLKIKDLDINILRLGNPDKVSWQIFRTGYGMIHSPTPIQIMPSLAHLTLAGKETATSIAELERRYFAPQVVATTALSIDHPLFLRRKFDYCIVDEASQITLPTCLGPLRFADTFVLVGDHNQLPPLVCHFLPQPGMVLMRFFEGQKPFGSS
jgi:DNA replication ATP-dependent helicase Dna2